MPMIMALLLMALCTGGGKQGKSINMVSSFSTTWTTRTPAKPFHSDRLWRLSQGSVTTTLTRTTTPHFKYELYSASTMPTVEKHDPPRRRRIRWRRILPFFRRGRNNSTRTVPGNGAACASAEIKELPVTLEDESVIEMSEQISLEPAEGTLASDADPAVVTFRAVEEWSSDPVPCPPSLHQVNDFFRATAHRNLLFSADAIIQDISFPPETLQTNFQRESSKGRIQAGFTNASPPTDRTETALIQLTNPTMPFIGIKVQSIVTVGSHLVKGNTQTSTIISKTQKATKTTTSSRQEEEQDHPGLPEYQFTLLDSTFQAHGPRPLVWLFNRLMGIGPKTNPRHHPNNKAKAKHQPSQKTSGFTRVWAESIPSQEVKPQMVFKTMALLETTLRIPPFLIKLLPMSVEQLEEQGSLTLQKTVSKDVVPAMDRFRVAYLDWLEEQP